MPFVLKNMNFDFFFFLLPYVKWESFAVLCVCFGCTCAFFVCVGMCEILGINSEMSTCFFKKNPYQPSWAIGFDFKMEGF